MKTVGFVLMTVALVLGVVGAASAYTIPLSLPDDELVGLTLNAPAGAQESADGDVEPRFEKDHVLTASDVAQVRVDGERRVVVKEFAFGRWTGRWLFLVGILGLGVGAMFVRRASAQEVADAASARAERGESPHMLLVHIAEGLDALDAALASEKDETRRLALIREHLDVLAKGPMTGFLDASPEIAATSGTAGMARVLDPYATAERRLNRAWSAAADGVEAEAREALEMARDSLDEAVRRASGAAPAEQRPAASSE